MPGCSSLGRGEFITADPRALFDELSSKVHVVGDDWTGYLDDLDPCGSD